MLAINKFHHKEFVFFISAIAFSLVVNSQPLGIRDKGIQQIEVVSIHFYKSYEYNPVKRLSLEASSDAIEKNLALHFDAMKNGLISNFLNLWEADSQREIIRLQQRDTPDVIIQRWKSMLDGRDVEITNRYKYKDYDLIEYQLVDKATKIAKFSDLMVFTNVNQSPKLTLELKMDPVIRAIRERKKRVEDVVGLMPKK